VSPAPRVGVVGHVEWVEFVVIDHFPRPGEIVHASTWFSEAAGGGAVAAVQLRKLAGEAIFFAALGDDAVGAEARRELERRHRVELYAALRPRPQRRGFTQLDEHGERTITIMGERIVPHGGDRLPWERVGELDGVYLTGGDAEAVRRARAAKVLVATARALAAIEESGVRLDVLLGSATDDGEQIDAARLDPHPRYIVRTRGKDGGDWEGAGGERGAWGASEVPGEPVDAYGCGDSFAAGLTYGLAAGMTLAGALEMGARCGAWALTGRGPYGRQLTLV
jgi:ribokinase